jgi:dCMP deaminase
MDKFGRPNWDSYFMTLAFVTAQRSLDPRTKHGTVVVAQDNTILAVGYNSAPRGCKDENIPLDPPDKYEVLIHSEPAAICNAARHGISLKDSVFYVTGFPCHLCWREIINVGASEVVYGPVGSFCVEGDITKDKYTKIMLEGQNIKIRKYEGDVLIVLDSTMAYIDYKLNQKI